MFFFIFFHLHYYEIQFLGGGGCFGVADYEFEHNIQNFKRTDLIWWIKMQKSVVGSLWDR